MPREPSRLGCACRRHHRGVQRVQVDADENISRQMAENLADPGSISAYRRGRKNRHVFFPDKGGLLDAHAPNPGLDDRAELPHPPADASVAERSPLVGLPHVRVCIQVKHREIRKAFPGGPDGSQRDAVLTAEHDGGFPQCENARDSFLDTHEHPFRSCSDGLERRKGVYPRLVYLPVQFLVVELHVAGGLDDGRRPFAGPSLVGRCQVVGHGDNDKGCRFRALRILDRSRRNSWLFP